MNTRKILSASFGLLLAAGCGQEYSPSPDENIPAPHGGGDVFDNNGDSVAYRTASYEVLRFTITNTLNLGTGVAPNTSQCGTTPINQCPAANPVRYLDDNRAALGTPVYSPDPLSTLPPGPITSGGFKVWIQASSSACGRMMHEQGTPALFPSGINDYTYMYNVLLGRAPTQQEIEILNDLKTAVLQVPADPSKPKPPSTTPEQIQGAAVCSAV